MYLSYARHNTDLIPQRKKSWTWNIGCDATAALVEDESDEYSESDDSSGNEEEVL